MASIMDKVHDIGMSENGSTYMTVDEANGVRVEPPIQVILEGESANVAVTQDALAARYQNDELCLIGEGNSMLGLQCVINEIATNGNLEHGAIKPLHPNLIEVNVVASVELTAPVRELTA